MFSACVCWGRSLTCCWWRKAGSLGLRPTKRLAVGVPGAEYPERQAGLDTPPLEPPANQNPMMNKSSAHTQAEGVAWLRLTFRGCGDGLGVGHGERHGPHGAMVWRGSQNRGEVPRHLPDHLTTAVGLQGTRWRSER